MSKNNQELCDTLAEQLIESGADLSQIFEKGGLLKTLTKSLLEKALEGEMNHHLGYPKSQRNTKSNSRNGTSTKRLSTDNGNIEISVPRDRSSSFEPQIVPKRITKINGLDDKIISMYARGLSVSDIQSQLYDLYETEVSSGFISEVTNSVLEEVHAWQNRPLDSIYPIVFFDCIVVKVRQDKQITNKAVYVALGLNMEGRKEVLGLWISKNEGAKYWLNVFTELKNRGLQDILIICTDNLKGMNESIVAAYPEAEHQLCIVHQIRNSLKYVSYKKKKEVAADLKDIYTAVNEDVALDALNVFKEKYDSIYPQISKSWDKHWVNLINFLKYPKEIRKVIYTTNAIESLNSQFRKVIKNKKVFPSDDAVYKILYLAISNLEKKWTMPARFWNEAMPFFLIQFEDRLQAYL
jgi:transposase-like protein